MATVKLFDVLWQVKNAGASPDDNRRTELYFAGCRKALSGNPCKNCFNPKLWDSSLNIPQEPEKIVEALDRHKVPKYITIVGGEPTDQLDGLVELINLLYEHEYETILFTWHSPFWTRINIGIPTLKKLAYIVCGPYDETKRIYDTSKDDGVHNVIGSSNQIILRYVHHGMFKSIPVDQLDRIEYQAGVPLFISKEAT